jgi:hypothetical protein
LLKSLCQGQSFFGSRLHVYLTGHVRRWTLEEEEEWEELELEDESFLDWEEEEEIWDVAEE